MLYILNDRCIIYIYLGEVGKVLKVFGKITIITII